MAVKYTKNGVDLDTLFEPRLSGDPRYSGDVDLHYLGIDLADKYWPLSESGDPVANNTEFLHNGTDLRTIFAALGTSYTPPAIPASPAWHYSGYNNTPVNWSFNYYVPAGTKTLFINPATNANGYKIRRILGVKVNGSPAILRKSIEPSIAEYNKPVSIYSFSGVTPSTTVSITITTGLYTSSGPIGNQNLYGIRAGVIPFNKNIIGAPADTASLGRNSNNPMPLNMNHYDGGFSVAAWTIFTQNGAAVPPAPGAPYIGFNYLGVKWGAGQSWATPTADWGNHTTYHYFNADGSDDGVTACSAAFAASDLSD